MSELILCSSCTRHFRKDEPRCPFCDAAVSEEQRAAVTVAAVAPGTSRARAYAARVAVIGSTALACSGTTTDTLPRDAGSDAAEDAGDSGGAGTGGTINIGGTINTGGRGGTNSGGTNSGGMGNTGNLPMPYGTVWPDDEEF